MANHGWVKTRKTLTPEQITTLLQELNATLFKGHLQQDYQRATREQPGWGAHTWFLSYQLHAQEWARRVCWLETSRHFEMRHGGGSDFTWWLDAVILNAVAVRFNGKIGGDGHNDWKVGVPGKYDSFAAYLVPQLARSTDPVYQAAVLEQVPPEFRP